MDTKKILENIQEFRKISPRIHSQTISVFLYVAINEGKQGVPMTSIENFTKLSQSSVSRNVALLSKWSGIADKDKKIRKPGLNFVETFEDPMEKRRKLVRLTTKGKVFFSKLN